MRVLVTGATGFLGRHLFRFLAAAGDEVIGTGLNGDTAPPGMELHELDVRDRAAVAAVVRRVQPDAIVHLAALSHVGESWLHPEKYFQVNVLGTEAVIDAAGPARVLFVSSAEVYGLVPHDEQPIPEERPLAPRSPYALTKAAAERLVLSHGAVVARCFNLLGPGQAHTFALPSFACQLAAIAAGSAEPVLKVGNLTAYRDFVHVEEATRAVRLLLERGEAGTAYNVASGEAQMIGDLVDRLIVLSGLSVRLEQDPARLRPIDVPRLCGQAERLAALGWRPQRTVDEAIAGLWAEVSGRR